MRGLASLIILASALVVTPIYSQDSTQLKGPKGADYGAQGRSIGPIKPTDTPVSYTHLTLPTNREV